MLFFFFQTEYDLYISHLMDTHSSQDNVVNINADNVILENVQNNMLHVFFTTM